MNNKLRRDIQILNALPLTEYLQLLGYQPIEIRPCSAAYEVYIDNAHPVTITIDRATNRFTDRANNRSGSLADFVCLLYGINTIELCSNIMPHMLDRLMSQQPISFPECPA